MSRALLSLGPICTGSLVCSQDSVTSSNTERVFPGRAHSAHADRAGTTLLPRDAYRFARSEPVTSDTGQPVKLSRPLDFCMITDPSGAITDIIGGAPHILADEQGPRFHEGLNSPDIRERANAARERTSSFGSGEISDVLNYQPGNSAYAHVWADLGAASEEFNAPGVFTTFAAFEWTPFEAARTLHRNVIFRDGPDKTLQIVP